MLLSKLQNINLRVKNVWNRNKFLNWQEIRRHIANNNVQVSPQPESSTTEVTPVNNEVNVYQAVPRVVPVLLRDKEPIVLPFDEVPGPKSLKYLSIFRNYLSEIGTQITANFLLFGLNVG